MMTALLLLAFVATEPEATFVLAKPVATFTIKATTAECTCNPCECEVCDCAGYTEELKAKAVQENSTLVVFCGQKAKRVNGAMSCETASYGGDSTPRVIYLQPYDGRLWERPPQQESGQRERRFQRSGGGRLRGGFGGGGCSGGR